MTIRELHTLTAALRHWRELLRKRHGWAVADDAYVRHGAICSAALLGTEV